MRSGSEEWHCNIRLETVRASEAMYHQLLKWRLGSRLATSGTIQQARAVSSLAVDSPAYEKEKKRKDYTPKGVH